MVVKGEEMGEVDEKAGGNKKKETFQVNLPTSIKNERSSRGKFLLTRDAQKWNRNVDCSTSKKRSWKDSNTVAK